MNVLGIVVVLAMSCAALAQPSFDDPVALLREDAPLYSGRTPSEVAQLRAQQFTRLAEQGVPPDALPFIVAELAHGHKPLPIAAAARAAAAAGPAASAAAPYLLRLLGSGFHDQQLALDEHGLTSVRIEAVRALESFGASAGDEALAALRELANDRGLAANELGPVLRDAVEDAVAKIAPAPSCHTAAAPPLAFASLWSDAAERKAPALDAFPELAGKPVALTFFYTRCDNDRKCSTNLSRFAQLQSATAGLAGKVRLVAITYDPEYDTPLQLARFASGRGLHVSDDLRLVRSTPAELAQLAQALGLAVNFADGRPNIHGVELFVLDRKGRVAREYRNVIWDEQSVLADLAKLALE